MFDEARLDAAQELIEMKGVKLYYSIPPLLPELPRSSWSGGEGQLCEERHACRVGYSQASAPGLLPHTDQTLSRPSPPYEDMWNTREILLQD